MLAHTIVAVVGDTPKKVECNTCGALHAYKAHEPGKAPKKASSRSSSRTAKKPALKPSDYEKMVEGRDITHARRYSPRTQFEVSEIFQHPKFGMGIVVSLKDATKIEVLFPEGPKVLVHNR